MAVITKILLPQTIGLECERPGMLVFQSTFCDFSRSQVLGGFVPSATPDAFGPRNEGQFCALTVTKGRKRTKRSRRFILQSILKFSTSSRRALSRAFEFLLRR